MTQKKQSSFNGLVYKKTYKRLKLNPTQRIVFQRLLGFLIRNDKPFPFSTTSLSELTGFSPRAIVNALNRLEYLRLINRKGLGKARRFTRGSILRKIMATAHISSNEIQVNNATTAHVVRQNLTNCARGAYSKTSLSLKLKEGSPPIQDLQNFNFFKNKSGQQIPDNLKYVGEWLDKHTSKS